MTDQEINKAIHSALGLDQWWLIQKEGWFYKPNCYGYTQLPQDAGRFTRAVADLEAAGCAEIRVVPTVPRDYANDLNACAEFEQMILDRVWSDKLMNVIRDTPSWSYGAVEARYATAKATARQRCEAYLRMKNLWKA